MEILFEDEGLIVCVKPPGMISQRDSGGGESMADSLAAYTGGLIFPVHRLDRETGGIMVFAKTPRSAAALSRQISERSFEKEYLAMLHGVPEEEEGILRDLLFKDSAKNKSYVVLRERKGVRKAELCYRLLETAVIEGAEYSLISVRLHTGRTHQIRVQFAHRKMPLAGDIRYGARDRFGSLGLWSYKIAFLNPITGERGEYVSKPQNIISEYFGCNSFEESQF